MSVASDSASNVAASTEGAKLALAKVSCAVITRVNVCVLRLAILMRAKYCQLMHHSYHLLQGLQQELAPFVDELDSALRGVLTSQAGLGGRVESILQGTHTHHMAKADRARAEPHY